MDVLEGVAHRQQQADFLSASFNPKAEKKAYENRCRGDKEKAKSDEQAAEIGCPGGGSQTVGPNFKKAHAELVEVQSREHRRLE